MAKRTNRVATPPAAQPPARQAAQRPAKTAQLPILSTRLGHKQGCCTASDAADARRVADRLDIPFYALDFQKDFGRIMDYFVDEYTAGRTPNPCVMCNNWLKFGTLADYADSVAADYIATGHYARIIRTPGSDEPALVRGVDPTKDQSYVLFGLRREILARVLLPVGDFQKSEIRDRARHIGLRVADKQDSQEICFVPDNDYAAFVRRRRGDADLSGEIVTTSGEVVGRHTGIENFTIGQRKGLGLAFGTPRVRGAAGTRYAARRYRHARRLGLPSPVGTRRELADRATANATALPGKNSLSQPTGDSHGRAGRCGSLRGPAWTSPSTA